MGSNQHIKYWIDESMESIDVAKILFAQKKYLESAFFCNLSCEKMLKASFVCYTSETPPKTHSLTRMAQLSNIYDKMDIKQKRFLNTLEVFQIEGRYPQDRNKLYNTTPAEVFSRVLTETEEIILWIKQQLI